MTRNIFHANWTGRAVLILMLGAAALPARLCAGEDERTALRFLQQLKEHGLHDLALEYVGQLRSDATISENLKAVLDYEEGRTLIDEAARTNDLVLRQQLLQEARDKLDVFIKGHPQLEQTKDALVQMARLLVERGHLAVLLSLDAQDQSKKDAKLAEARSSFTQAHDAYESATKQLEAAHKQFVGFIPETDPRRDQRDAIFISLLNAKLQRGMCDYERAQTFPADSKERARILEDAAKQFDDMYKNYRTQMAGLTAQMMLAKCYEEQGKVGEAIGIYKILLEHSDPRLRALQRNVGYFYIVALGKRKEYALAADQALRWLETYNRRDERRSREGLGVLYERAKAIDARWSEIPSGERPAWSRQIIDALTQVSRYASAFKNDALELLKKYKPSAALRAEEISRLSYQDAIDRGQEAIAAHEWERAIALLKAAVRKVDPARDAERANFARYNLAFCYYMNKQFYEADILAEHLARRYPQGGLSAKATEIAMQALADAYNTYTAVDRLSDIERLADLARYTADTWADRDQGDDARINLGQIHGGRGQYDEAIKVFGAVRRRSQRFVESQARLGAAHWAKSRSLERRGDSQGAKAEADQALLVLRAALKARRDGGAAQTDAGYVGNVGDLAIVLTETGKPSEALALLEPVMTAQTARSGPAYSRLMEAALQAYVSSNQVEKAIGAMKGLEQAGGAAGRASLYYRLGKLLEKELDALRAKRATSELNRMQHAFQTFLTTLAESKTGQTYESLQWAGESLLAIDASAAAEQVLRRVLTEFAQDPAFLQQQNGSLKLLRTKLKLAAALRAQGKFDEAASLTDELIAQHKGYIEPLFERGMLLEAQGKRDEWSTALAYWEDLAKRVERLRPRREVYYETWYHVASVLAKQKDAARARQTLNSIMKLAPSVGSPEMKAKYEGLLAQLK
jgi:tetratricopeptide (TPR) repeat protein